MEISEREKMLSGLLYNPMNKTLLQERIAARTLLKELNDLRPNERKKHNTLIKQLFPNAAANFWIQTPFYCDYGYNIFTEENVFFNFNCVVLDVMPVTIGKGCMIGPAVQIYTATHPTNAAERATGLEFAKPVTIGKDVWVGGGAIICPGVTIGDRVVIAAGSVVTKDIPNDVMVGGNPCAIIKQL